MLETKIKNIFYTWILSLCLVLSVFGTIVWFFGTEAPQSTTEAAAAEPKVLGAFTQARGGEESLVPKPEILGPVNMPEVTAKSFLVYDEQTGDIIFERNATSTQSIASLTKLVTGLVAIQSGVLDKTVEIASEDEFSQTPLLRLKAGDEVRALDLFNAMIVGSANDAAQTLAHFVTAQTGHAFVELMNDAAQTLGMNSSKFSNPLGFDSDSNYSTALDLKKLVDATQKTDLFSSLGKKDSYVFTATSGKQFKIIATDKLPQAYPEISAIKTGTTPQAGQAIITKMIINGHSVICIVLQSKDRLKDSLQLEKAVSQNTVWK